MVVRLSITLLIIRLPVLLNRQYTDGTLIPKDTRSPHGPPRRESRKTTAIPGVGSGCGRTNRGRYRSGPSASARAPDRRRTNEAVRSQAARDPRGSIAPGAEGRDRASAKSRRAGPLVHSRGGASAIPDARLARDLCGQPDSDAVADGSAGRVAYDPGAA